MLIVHIGAFNRA